MALVKKTTNAVVPAPAPEITAPAQTAPAAAPESGTAAAIGRLKKKTEAVATATPSTTAKYAGRDFDAEARGKTRCVQFEAALMSPAIAGMKFDTMEQYLALVKQAAEAGVAYTFGEGK